MGIIASQITRLTIVYSTVYSGDDQRKHQSSALLAFVRGIHRRPMNSPHKGPVTRKCFHLMTSSCIISLLDSVILRKENYRDGELCYRWWYAIAVDKYIHIWCCSYMIYIFIYIVIWYILKIPQLLLSNQNSKITYKTQWIPQFQYIYIYIYISFWNLVSSFLLQAFTVIKFSRLFYLNNIFQCWQNIRTNEINPMKPYLIRLNKHSPSDRD